MKRLNLLTMSFIFLGAIAIQVARADVINVPIHPHGPSPVTTWPVPPVGPPFQHQHRTDHNPNGIGSVHNYVADKSWMAGVQHLSPGSGGTHGDFAHGHMDVPTCYDFHTIVRGGVSIPVPATAQANIIWAFEQWNAVSAGEINWPGSDDDTVAGTGIQIHSTINFQNCTAFPADHVHIEWNPEGLVGPGRNALAAYFPASRTLRFDPAPLLVPLSWHFGGGAGGVGLYDFRTTALHEAGHVVAFDHWGSFAAGDVMNPEPQAVIGTPPDPVTGLPRQTILRTLNHATIHATRDVYSIPGAAHPAVPEPSTWLLFIVGTGGILGLGFKRRKKA